MDTTRFKVEFSTQLSASQTVVILLDRINHVYTYKILDLDAVDFMGGFDNIEAALNDAKWQVE
jgi:hypothetical protein